MAAQPNGRRADTFDDMIVGAGAAGSALASRLTEDAGVTVGVRECGPPDRHRADGAGDRPDRSGGR
jgi:choline dehydrogenase-like flavoprotein